MKLNSLRIGMANVARTPNAKTLEVVNTGATKVRLDNGTYSDQIDNYIVECAVNRGDTLKVKFPLSVANKIENLKNFLYDDNALVEISFTNLKLFPYALKTNDGSVLSGVSAKADDFEIHVKEFDMDFDDTLLNPSDNYIDINP